MWECEEHGSKIIAALLGGAPAEIWFGFKKSFVDRMPRQRRLPGRSGQKGPVGEATSDPALIVYVPEHQWVQAKPSAKRST